MVRQETYVALEVHLHHLEICHRYGGLEGGRFLVGLEPFAAQPLGLIVGLNNVGTILDDNGVLIELALQIRLGSALVVVDVEGCVREAAVWFHVDAVLLSVGALREDYPIEGPRELRSNCHRVFATDHVERLDLATCWAGQVLEQARLTVRGMMGDQLVVADAQTLLLRVNLFHRTGV